MYSPILTHYNELKKLKKINPDKFNNKNYDTISRCIKNYLDITSTSTKVYFYTNYYILNKLLKISNSNIQILMNFFEKRDFFLSSYLERENLISNNPTAFLNKLSKTFKSKTYYQYYSHRDKIKSELFNHIFFKYQVPNHLIYACEVNTHRYGNNKICYNLLKKVVFSIGDGESLYNNIQNGKFVIKYKNKKYNFPLLSKKECHNYLTYNDDAHPCHPSYKFVSLIMRAIIISNNGSELLKNEVCKNCRFDLIDFLNEKNYLIYSNILKWFCEIENKIKKENMDFSQINPMFDYLLNCFKDEKYSLKGRTYSSVLKQMELWHKELRKDQFRHLPEKWEKCNINDFETQDDEKNNLYTFNEILNINDLYDEGKELQHCVLSYINKIHRKESTIWSIKQNNKRLLTIELSAQKRILQICGYRNRYPTVEELLILDEWFKKEELVKFENKRFGF